MSVSTGGKRLVAAAFVAALLASVAAGPTALAHHSPGSPSYVAEYSVPESAGKPIANGSDSSYVAGVIPRGAGGPSLKLFSVQTVLSEFGYVNDLMTVPLDSDQATVKGIATGAVPPPIWIAVSQLGNSPSTPRGQIFDYGNPLTPIVDDAGYDMIDITRTAEGVLWFMETVGETQTRIGKIDPVNPRPPYAPINGIKGSELASGQSPDGLVRFIGRDEFGVTKLVTFDPSTNRAQELQIPACQPSCSPVYGPDNSLWFIEATPAGTSITKFTVAGEQLTQHLLPGISPTDLATGDNGLWFTTGSQGNVGHMAADGKVTSLMCVGSGHPAQIAVGPRGGPNQYLVTFTLADEDKVLRIHAGAAGEPCPPPPVPSPGVSGLPVSGAPVAKDTTAAKISLSGKRTQRFTRKGAIVVRVRCSEDCTARVQATVSTGGAANVFRSQRVTRRLAGGKRAKFTLKFGKAAVKAIRRGLRRNKPLKANVAIATRDRSGNASRAKRSVRLKR